MFGFESERGWQRRIAQEVVESLESEEEASEGLIEEVTAHFIEEHYDLGEMDEDMHDRLLENIQKIVEQVQEKLIEEGHLSSPPREEEVENWWEGGEEV